MITQTNNFLLKGILIGVAISALASCGGDNNNDPTPSPSPSPVVSPDPSPSPSPSPDPTADADSDGVVDADDLCPGTPSGATVDSDGCVLVDGPTVAAPTPTADQANVISLFSDAYTNIDPIDLNPDWGQGTVVTEMDVAGNNTLSLASLNFQGIDFAANHQDVSGMDSFHLDFWSDNASALSVFLISPPIGDGAAVETEVVLTLVSGSWASVDIPLTDFSPVDLADVFQLKFVGDGDVYIDNLYFETAAAAAGGAPVPTQAPAGVISAFSDSYTSFAGIDLNPDWGQGTVTTEVDIDGNNTLSMAGLDFQGIDFNANHQDVSGMTTLHIDFKSLDSTALNIFLISPGPNENAYALPVEQSDNWVSVDIPLTTFTLVDLTDAFQFKFDGNGNILIDNLYFY
jgi:hypothetical protein